jgi:hypothetical protein
MYSLIFFFSSGIQHIHCISSILIESHYINSPLLAAISAISVLPIYIPSLIARNKKSSMATSLLGHCPGEAAINVIAVSAREGSSVSSKQSIRQEPNRVSNDAAIRPGSAVSEVYGALSSPLAVSQKQVCTPGSSNIMSSEPGLTDSINTENFEWRKFQPPKELFDVPYGTPLEIESIIIASVERLQQQLAEEQSFHKNEAMVRAREASRVEREIPQIEVPAEPKISSLLIVSNN